MATEQRLSEAGPEQAKQGSGLGSEPESEAEIRALREALADAEERAGNLAVVDALMGREIVVNEEDPDTARWRRVARSVLEKWHGEPAEQENAVVELLFRERQRGRGAAEDAVQDALTEENVLAAVNGDVQNSAPMDAGRLRIRVLKGYFKHHAAGRDLEGKPRV